MPAQDVSVRLCVCLCVRAFVCVCMCVRMCIHTLNIIFIHTYTHIMHTYIYAYYDTHTHTGIESGKVYGLEEEGESIRLWRLPLKGLRTELNQLMKQVG